MKIPRSLLLTKRNVLNKICRENQNTRFMPSNIFSENRAVYEIIWKNMLHPEGHRRKYNTAHALSVHDN
jgi:hypothetical protein